MTTAALVSVLGAAASASADYTCCWYRHLHPSTAYELLLPHHHLLLLLLLALMDVQGGIKCASDKRHSRLMAVAGACAHKDRRTLSTLPLPCLLLLLLLLACHPALLHPGCCHPAATLLLLLLVVMVQLQAYCGHPQSCCGCFNKYVAQRVLLSMAALLLPPALASCGAAVASAGAACWCWYFCWCWTLVLVQQAAACLTSSAAVLPSLHLSSWMKMKRFSASPRLKPSLGRRQQQQQQQQQKQKHYMTMRQTVKVIAWATAWAEDINPYVQRGGSWQKLQLLLLLLLLLLLRAADVEGVMQP
jgi:hypothetical protein